jgi:hypothetical protein
MAAQTSRTSLWLKGRRRCGSLWLQGRRRCSSRGGRGWAMEKRSGGGFLERTRWQSSPPASTLRHRILPTIVEQRRTPPPPWARGRGTGGRLDSSPMKTRAAARQAARGPSHSRDPPSPPPRGRRNQPPEWMHKMMQQAAGTPGLFGEVCFSLFSAEEVFCRCRTTICCGQSYSATFKFHPAASISPVRHRAGVDVESQTQLAAAWVGAQGSSRQAQNQQQAGPSD